MNGQVANKAPSLKRPVQVRERPEPTTAVEGDGMPSQEYIEFVDKSLEEFFAKYPY